MKTEILNSKNKAPEKCPVCGEFHPGLIKKYHKDLDAPLIKIIQSETTGWEPQDGACTRCVDQANLELQLSLFEGLGEPVEVNGFKILPVNIRLKAKEQFSGKGVTICMIDSGFYPHPDLIYPQNRILKVLDITKDGHIQEDYGKPVDDAWHGTMTSVVCAGNGHLSGGRYKGLAHNSNLLLIKARDNEGLIRSIYIQKAISWAIENRKKYNIRIINISLGGDGPGRSDQSPLAKTIKEAVAKGISVVTAAGNDSSLAIVEPADAPYSLTIGGLNDRNTLDPYLNTLYHSSFGQSYKDSIKPDLIAPAIWIPIPILPKSKEQSKAEALFKLFMSSDQSIKAILANLSNKLGWTQTILNKHISEIRSLVREQISESKFISGHYMHGDGTSFAAPIVSSVIAQMLEANPSLDPMAIREILCLTARKLVDESADRQGWGVLNACQALEMASGQPLSKQSFQNPIINYKDMTIEFNLHHPYAKEVALVGDFTNWETNAIPMDGPDENGEWKKQLVFFQQGEFRYKYLIDQKEWISDPRNLFSESDGLNGFNSKMFIS